MIDWVLTSERTPFESLDLFLVCFRQTGKPDHLATAKYTQKTWYSLEDGEPFRDAFGRLEIPTYWAFFTAPE